MKKNAERGMTLVSVSLKQGKLIPTQLAKIKGGLKPERVQEA